MARARAGVRQVLQFDDNDIIQLRIRVTRARQNPTFSREIPEIPNSRAKPGRSGIPGLRIPGLSQTRFYAMRHDGRSL